MGLISSHPGGIPTVMFARRAGQGCRTTCSRVCQQALKRQHVNRCYVIGSRISARAEADASVVDWISEAASERGTSGVGTWPFRCRSTDDGSLAASLVLTSCLDLAGVCRVGTNVTVLPASWVLNTEIRPMRRVYPLKDKTTQSKSQSD